VIKILELDLGTYSIGWAVVDKENNLGMPQKYAEYLIN